MNCPNCSAPLNPTHIKCDYCGSYFLDFVAIDLKYKTPCFLRIRTDQGVVIAKAQVSNASMTVSHNDTAIVGYRGTPVIYTSSPTAELNIDFECIPFDSPVNNQKTLFMIDNGGENNGENS